MFRFDKIPFGRIFMVKLSDNLLPEVCESLNGLFYPLSGKQNPDAKKDGM